MDKPNAATAQLTFQEPPDVKVIEASCKHAQQKSSDFSSFTTVLTDPITINKGDEIRAVASYIDCPGIDSQIIQFTRSGGEQDNAHTLLTQSYTVNDGFQQKTTSYDYMTRNSLLTTANPGGDLTPLPTTIPHGSQLELRTYDPITNQAIGLGAFLNDYYVGINALENITYDNNTTNWSDGDKIVWTLNNSLSTAEVILFTNGRGKIVSHLITNPGFNCVDADHKVITKNTNASDANFVFTYTPTARKILIPTAHRSATTVALDAPDRYLYPSLGVVRADYLCNDKYRPGDLAEIWMTNNQINTSTAGVDTGARVYLNSVYQGKPSQTAGSVAYKNQPQFFDQGYNYQRIGLQRWAQTYENTSMFTYGRNMERKYLANDNIEYSLPDISAINKKDSCLSASMITRRKEDEFVPGFFHNEYNDDNSTFTNMRCAIELTSTNSEFTIGREDGAFRTVLNIGEQQSLNKGRMIFKSIKKKEYFDSNAPLIEKNQIEVDYFPNSLLVPGMVVSLKFALNFPLTDGRNTTANQLIVYNEFQQKWGGIFPIGTQTPILVSSDGGATRLENYIGAPAMYDASLGTRQFTQDFLNNGSPTHLEFVGGVASLANPSGLNPGSGQTAIFYWVSGVSNKQTLGGNFQPTVLPGIENFINYILLEFNVNGTGQIINTPYFQSANLPPAQKWRAGDLLRPITTDTPVPGYPFEAIYNKLDPALKDLRILITAVDGGGGADFNTFDQLDQTKLVTSNNLPVRLLITPMPYYMAGIQTFRSNGEYSINPNAYGVQRENTTPILDANGNTIAASSNHSFDNYNNVYPPSYINAHALKVNPNGSNELSTNSHCVLYKPAGIPKTISMGTKNNIYSFHDSDQELILDDATTSESLQFNFTVGPTTGTAANSNHIIQASATISANQKTYVFNLAKIAADHPEVTTFDDLPIHGLMILAYGTVEERHVMMDGLVTDQGNDLYSMAVKSCCVPQTSNYGFTLPATMAGIDPGKFIVPTISTAIGFGDITAGTVSVRWIPKPWATKQGFKAKFSNKLAGSIAYTSGHNFFGENDVNLNNNSLLKSSSWRYIKSHTFNKDQNLSSYNKGGIYLMSQNIGAVLGTEDRSPYRSFFGFSQGMAEFIMMNGEPELTPSENKVPAVYNNKLPLASNEFLGSPRIVHAMANDITNIYGYEPLYNQKTFVMDRNFVVPSDIASRWDAQSHKQQGLIDRDTGELLAGPQETGLVQNEFIHPVYGSNNYILPSGEYLKDEILHPYSSGLRGGHCIGVGFIDRKQAWLNPNLYPFFNNWVGKVSPTLTTTNADNIKHYKLYFRTAFTFIRNYDPTKMVTGNAADYFIGGVGEMVVPDRTPLHTLQTAATNIGNCSRIGSNTQPKPNPDIPPKVKYLIDGTVMSWTESPAQILNPANSTTTDRLTLQFDPNVPPNSTIIGELLERADIPNNPSTDPGPRDGTTSTPTFTAGKSVNFPSTCFAYPFNYISNSSDVYDRALVSQFVGSSNVTLAFQTSISSFTFQFLHEPFTSPFRDGNGGDLATRIFYGNRKEGIYNHDSLGGVVVWNYARPTYPRGVFTVDEIGTKPDNTIYPNGVDPFSSVAVIGNRFLNKIGFKDSDLDIVNSKIDTENALVTGFSTQVYTNDLVLDTDPGTLKITKSIDIKFLGTNYSLIDSSDAILSAIDAPENSASLNKNNTIKASSRNRKDFMVQLNGDYIFYPYSLSGSTDSFQQNSGSVRYDNCTDAYGSVGGMRLSNVARGMGTPNTQGSTSICDQTSIPVTLNVDCNLYLSYSAATPNSNLIAASNLPKKINHGHLVVLSSLVEEPNFIMAKAGAINGISLISKAFLTGDFILSNGMLSWYAKKTRVVSSITTRIVNTNFESPTVLGNNTTVVYSITNNQPKPQDRPTTIYEIQQSDYQAMDMMSKHLASVGNSGVSSPLTELEGMLDKLGIGIVTGGDTSQSADIISELRNQINAFGLARLSVAQRTQFFSTPAGQAFVQNAGAMRNIMSNMKNIDRDQQNINDGLGDEQLIAQHNKNIRSTMLALRQEGHNARARMADNPYVIPPDPLTEPNFVAQQQILDHRPFEDQVREASELKDLPHAGRRPPEGDSRKIKGDKLQALKEKRRQAMEYKLETEEKERERVGQQSAPVQVGSNPAPVQINKPQGQGVVRVEWSSGDMGATVTDEGGGATRD